MIEKAMKECHLAVKPNKNSKQQALESIGKSY
jgi:ribosome maturation protein Sdo1